MIEYLGNAYLEEEVVEIEPFYCPRGICQRHGFCPLDWF